MGTNDRLPTATVESLFGVAVAAVGVVSAVRAVRDLRAVVDVDPATRTGEDVFAVVGFIVGVVSGLLGIGGLAVVVPALVLLGVPLLVTIGVGQVVSGLLSFVGATGFALGGAVEPGLVVLVAVPLLVGVLVGLKVAHRVPERPLALGLAGVLVCSGGFVVLG